VQRALQRQVPLIPASLHRQCKTRTVVEHGQGIATAAADGEITLEVDLSQLAGRRAFKAPSGPAQQFARLHSTGHQCMLDFETAMRPARTVVQAAAASRA
jgi:hypothetical protein